MLCKTQVSDTLSAPTNKLLTGTSQIEHFRSESSNSEGSQRILLRIWTTERSMIGLLLDLNVVSTFVQIGYYSMFQLKSNDFPAFFHIPRSLDSTGFSTSFQSGMSRALKGHDIFRLKMTMNPFLARGYTPKDLVHRNATNLQNYPNYQSLYNTYVCKTLLSNLALLHVALLSMLLN